MHVVSIVQQKGGVGKTTLAINLGGELTRRGHPTTLIDADPQASALAWASLQKLGFPVRRELLGLGGTSSWIRNVLKSDGSFIIIDTPAGLGSVFKASVEIADLIVVPCGPSSLDVNSARETLFVTAKNLKNDSGSKAKVVVAPTRVDVSTLEGEQITDELAGLGKTVLPSLGYDAYFVRAFAQGVTVSSAAPNSKAASEIGRVADVVLRELGIEPSPALSGTGPVRLASPF